MYIEVDYNPTPSGHFFISAGLNDKNALSFDWTTKGHRVIKQVLIKTRKLEDVSPQNQDSGGWDAIVLKDGKFLKRYHVAWTDKGKIDEVNNEVWETVWEKELPKETAHSLLMYSNYISDNYDRLDPDKMIEFENYIRALIEKYND